MTCEKLFLGYTNRFISNQIIPSFLYNMVGKQEAFFVIFILTASMSFVSLKAKTDYAFRNWVMVFIIFHTHSLHASVRS